MTHSTEDLEILRLAIDEASPGKTHIGRDALGPTFVITTCGYDSSHEIELRSGPLLKLLRRDAPPSTSDQERARDMVSFALRRAELCGTPHRMAAMPESIPAIDISIANLRSILEHLEAATRREAERAGYERALEDAAQEIIRLNSGGPIIAQEQAEAIRALKGLEEELI